jgi:hypothetical protein
MIEAHNSHMDIQGIKGKFVFLERFVCAADTLGSNANSANAQQAIVITKKITAKASMLSGFAL